MPAVTFRKCYPEHILLLHAQSAQRSDYATALGAQLGAIVEHGEAQSAWFDNRCVAAAGIFPKWRGTATAWALLSDAAGPHMLAITRRAKAAICASKYRRIEMTALFGFEPAQRWARALGFTMEAERLRCYDPDGRDMSLYALVRRDL